MELDASSTRTVAPNLISMCIVSVGSIEYKCPAKFQKIEGFGQIGLWRYERAATAKD